jgi:arginyl-tRNA synthetase
VAKAEPVSGYVNITLVESIWEEVLRDILVKGDAYGHQTWGNGQAVNVEYVSANPTGPLHAAHARGAVFGDVVANLLDAVGYQVVREYYINDAGQQVIRLAETVLHHCRALASNQVAVIPQGLYPGTYGQDIARCFMDQHPNDWDAQSLTQVGEFAVAQMMEDIKETLIDLGVFHSVFTSEKALQTAGLLEKMQHVLQEKGLVYQGVLPKPIGHDDQDWVAHPLMLFRSTDFGDEQDRALQRSDGAWTYFANDIAYHWDKAMRQTQHMINVWGADHASHVQRMTGAVRAITNQDLEVLVFQMVHFLQDGVPLKMSKRAGNFVLLRDVLSMIDKDVLRFMILTKKADTHLELDIVKMQQQSKENPVFYVQYAHARCCSVLRAARALFSEEQCTPDALAKADFTPWMDWSLVKILSDWPRQVAEAARCREPHRIPNYLHKLAHAFHALWQKGNQDASMKLMKPEALGETYAAMALIQATALVMASGLKILGIVPKEELR